MKMNTVYRENFLHPRNAQRLSVPCLTAECHSSLCGDMITLDAGIDGGRIVSVGYEVCGCSAVTAAASLLSERIKGMDTENALSITCDELKDELGITDVKRTPCVSLPINALKNLIKEYNDEQG